MKFRNKGRKIYKTKEKNYYGKTPAGKFFSVALSILLIGGLCFLGYSVAEPLINYTKRKGDNNVVSDAGLVVDPIETSVSPTAATINVEENNNVELYRAVSLKPEDMVDGTALKAAIEKITYSDEIEYVEVPLKISGGEIYYNTSVYEAQMSGAVKSSLTLQEIISEIQTAGYKPSASVSVFRDYIIPQTFPEMGYTTVDDGSQWIDDSIENGGKPWVSPFSEAEVTYISALTDEISIAGFEKVVYSDFVFPPFRESDMALMPEEVKNNERYLSLTSTVNLIYNKMLAGGSKMLLEVSAIDMLQKNDEVIQPMLIDINTLVLDVDFDELKDSVTTQETTYEFSGTDSEKLIKVIGLVEKIFHEYNIVIRIADDKMNSEEFRKVKDTLNQNGYTSFIIEQ